ncbi:serine/threonine protein kinase [Sphaeroforma arctica JP610]|uniref:Serine/threonine protein kinase n=1 Tax=Sphaeroforma arctica JP610 TaxID=667725 RepID=A0A0L0FV83_9EUKA|nr:serine/threonine protein kinase [Sphaeroforma arctica JP610]KNC79848.1 serine/threonine protein kinase [Sphaeroforma arctica JP610]|eukprot:XP_014153750.1 serine/threonine protein kinase [Sphaeroforma arctica JP610]
MQVWLRRKIDEVGRSDSSVLLTEQAKIVLRVRHPQIAAFLGFIMNPVITFVYESFQNGPLSTFLFDLSHPLTMRCRFEMALDIATGMHYLHNCQPHVVHLNITRHSVFVTRKYEAKLGDFTTAVSMGSQSDEKRYKQECLADIQALGKLLFELIAREEWNVVRFKALVEQCTALDRPSEVVEDTAPPPPLSTPPDSAGKSALVRRSINADGDHADCKARGPTVNHPEKGEACTEQVEGISSIQRERLPPTEVDALMREPSCATREAVRMAVQLIEACVFASDTVDSEPIKSARVVNRLEKIIMSLGDT